MASLELWQVSILEIKTFSASQLLAFPKLASLIESLSCGILTSPADVHQR